MLGSGGKKQWKGLGSFRFLLSPMLPVTALMCVVVWVSLNEEDDGLRKLKGMNVVPVATGGPCSSDGAAMREGETNRVRQALHEVRAKSGRSAVLLSSEVRAGTSQEVADLHTKGLVETAWRLPAYATPRHILQAAMDNHVSRHDEGSHQPYSLAVTASTYVHVISPKTLPDIALSIPSFCSPPRLGVSAWHGAGVGDAAGWSAAAAAGAQTVTIRDLMKLGATRADLAEPAIPGPGQLRRAALADAAMYMLGAAELMLAAMPAHATPSVSLALQELRDKVASDEETLLDALAALQPSVAGEGAGGGALPFSFFPPAPGAAMEYNPSPKIYLPIPLLPHNLSLVVLNPTSQNVTSRAPFYLSVQTREAVILSAVMPNGLCEVIDDASDAGSGSGDSSGGGDDGSSGGSDDDDAPVPRRQHDLVCLLEDIPAQATRNVTITLRPVSRRAAAGTATSADSSSPQVNNLCASVTYTGDGRFRFATRQLGGEGVDTMDVKFAPMREKAAARQAALQPFGAVKGIVEITYLCMAASVLAAAAGFAPRRSRLHDVVSVGVGVAVAVAFPLPIGEWEAIRCLLLPAVCVAASCGLSRGLVTLNLPLLKVLPVVLVGAHMAHPAWVSETMPRSRFRVEVNPGRVADELVLTYGRVPVTTTVTVWHGNVCSVDVEHYCGATGASMDLRTTFEGMGSAVVRHGGRVHPYRPHLSRRENTVVASSSVRVEGLSAHADVAFRPTCAVGVLPVGGDLLLDVRLTRDEGFATTIGVGGPGGGREAGHVPHLLVLNPTPGLAEAGLPDPGLLAPPDGVQLIRARELHSEDFDKPVPEGEGRLLVTLFNERHSRAFVSLSMVCRLPRCKGQHMHPCDHLGHPTCTSGERPPATHPIEARGYASFILASAVSLC